jgi:AAA15 family ATPase/GTPase
MSGIFILLYTTLGSLERGITQTLIKFILKNITDSLKNKDIQDVSKTHSITSGMSFRL